MKDNALVILLISTIYESLLLNGLTPVIKQSNQPTKLAPPLVGQDTVYITKINDKPHGNPGQKRNVSNGVMMLTETQIVHTRFQIEAQAIQKPSDQLQVTAADYIKAVVRGLQSATSLAALAAQTVGIFRIASIATTHFENDLGNFEASPMAEIVLAHIDLLSQIIPATLIVKPTVFQVS